MCWNRLLNIFIHFHIISCQTVYSLSNKGHFKCLSIQICTGLHSTLCFFLKTSLQLLAGLLAGERKEETTYEEETNGLEACLASKITCPFRSFER